MDLCSEKHEEVCYEGRICPVCDTRDDLQGQIDEIAKELSSAEKYIEELEASQND